MISVNIRKLYLSHNYLERLEGIECFRELTHLSVSFNRLRFIEDFGMVSETLEHLTVKGNYFIEKNPDHKSILVRQFPHLKELDSEPVQRQNLADAAALRKLFLTS